MSDDLISRRTIKSLIETIRDCWAISPYVSANDMKLYSKVFNVVLQEISDCQTVFDNKKVTEKLENLKDIPQDDSVAEIVSTRIWNKAIEKAIEIIEKGGIE